MCVYVSREKAVVVVVVVVVVVTTVVDVVNIGGEKIATPTSNTFSIRTSYVSKIENSPFIVRPTYATTKRDTTNKIQTVHTYYLAKGRVSTFSRVEL